MEFDILLPTVVFVVVMTAVFSYEKFEKKIKPQFGEIEIGTWGIVLMVLAMGLMVTVVALIPSRGVQILSIAAYSFIMFSFTYIIVKKLYIAVFPPIVYMLFYFFYWKLFILNLFAMIFAVIVTIYLGTLLSWKTTWVFAILLTIMDIFQVFITGFTRESANKMLELYLPVAVILPTYPAGTWIILGLGDIFLSGLLSIQTALKHGMRVGILTAVTISAAIFMFEVTFLNAMVGGIEYFPATVVVVSGWILGMGIIRLIHLRS